LNLDKNASTIELGQKRISNWTWTKTHQQLNLDKNVLTI